MNYEITAINNIIVMPSNIYFRELGAIWAVEKNYALISDCIEIWTEDSGQVFARKPSVDGKNFTKYELSPDTNYIVLMRSMDGATDFISNSPDSSVTVISEEDVKILSEGIDIISISENPDHRRDIKDAELIFSGGRGIMNEESFDALRELAKRYDANVGASRPMVDQGWAAWEEQVGQTGSIVKPKVYVAFGISGAVQHITGIEKSQNIIAVNLNKSSPIFRYANYGAYSDDNSIIRNMLNIIDGA